ncbi:MAG: 30S ribosomal protein THX [Rhodanobacteraceae bacterium]|nr:MAG: 30S ribosomal protein THX [Rhodanobacteraceae bacterium]
MGKGDKKTRKGKIYAASHGNVRPHSPTANAAVKKTAIKTAPRTAAKPAARTAPKPLARPAVKKTAAKKAAPKKST